MRPLTLLLAVLFSTAPLVAQKPSARYDDSVDFSVYETYSWQQRPEKTAEALAEGEPLDVAIRSGADDALSRTGLRRLDSGGQLTLNYHAGVVAGASGDRRRGWAGKDTTLQGSAGSMHNSAFTIPMGTIVLEVIDSESDELIWAGTGQFKIKSMEAPSDNPQIRSKANKLANKIARQFPPG